MVPPALFCLLENWWIKPSACFRTGSPPSYHLSSSLLISLHPHVIVEGWNLAKIRTKKFLEGFKIEKDMTDRELLTNIARTSLRCASLSSVNRTNNPRTKVSQKLADHLAEIVTDAVFTLLLPFLSHYLLIHEGHYHSTPAATAWSVHDRNPCDAAPFRHWYSSRKRHSLPLCSVTCECAVCFVKGWYSTNFWSVLLTNREIIYLMTFFDFLFFLLSSFPHSINMQGLYWTMALVIPTCPRTWRIASCWLAMSHLRWKKLLIIFNSGTRMPR